MQDAIRFQSRTKKSDLSRKRARRTGHIQPLPEDRRQKVLYRQDGLLDVGMPALELVHILDQHQARRWELVEILDHLRRVAATRRS